MSDKCPTCKRKIPKRVYTITGIFQNLGKVYSSSDLLKAKEYIYSTLDQLDATDEKKAFIHQRIENSGNTPHTRDDVYGIINEVLTLARKELLNKGTSLWKFINNNNYIFTGIDETFADFYGKFKLEEEALKNHDVPSTQLVSRLLKAIGIKSKTKRIGQSSCMYLKISSEDLTKKLTNAFGTTYSNDIVDYSSTLFTSSDSDGST